jgi:hypothetical protein
VAGRARARLNERRNVDSDAKCRHPRQSRKRFVNGSLERRGQTAPLRILPM